MRVLLLLALVLPACAGRLHAPLPDRPPEEPPLPGAFSQGGRAPFETRWWTAFSDPVLNGLVETALSDNLTLLAAEERVARAVALAERAGSALRPRLDVTSSAGAAVTRRRLAGETVDDSAEALSLGALAGCELDLWGRLIREA